MPQASPHVTRGNISIDAWDAHIIVGGDEPALLRLWRQKRGEAEPHAPSLIDRLGYVIEALSRECYEAHTGHKISIFLKRPWDPALFWMSAAVNGIVPEAGALFETAFLLPHVTEQEAAEICMPRLQHTMLITRCPQSVLSVITGDGRWFAITVEADPVYQTALMAAEKAFWHAALLGKPPRLFGIVPRRSAGAGVRVLTARKAADPNAHAVLPQSVDKSELMIGEPRRRRDKNHLNFVASRACTICGRKPCEAHHLRFAQSRALGRKVSDEFTLPLCRLHHRELHQFGNEAQWWNKAGIDPLPIALDLWTQSRGRTDLAPHSSSDSLARDTQSDRSDSSDPLSHPN